MNLDSDAIRRFLSRDLLDFFIRMGMIVVAIVACERIFAPFLPIMLWAMILAVSLNPLLDMLQARSGWSDGRCATLIVIMGITLIGVPTVLLGSSFAAHLFDVVGNFDAKEFDIQMPRDSVKEWPIIGERAFAVWTDAYTDFPAFMQRLQPQLANFSKTALGVAASTAGTLLFFLGALIIAGIMMAYGSAGSDVMRRVFCRIAGTHQGRALHTLSTLTVRSVAVGVVGVAFIQALLLGVGFLLAGIPAAGLLALVVLVIGILQLPALLVSLPAIAFIWGMGDGGTLGNIALTAYFLVAGFADNVLKPLLLGRGVDVPMPVVLLGALGGMVGAGIIGLFVGAVVLSVGYELFMGWLDAPEVTDGSEDPNDTADPAGVAS
ncbi:MAG: AI-2E family transporter [Congregibacter sp.]